MATNVAKAVMAVQLLCRRRNIKEAFVSKALSSKEKASF